MQCIIKKYFKNSSYPDIDELKNHFEINSDMSNKFSETVNIMLKKMKYERKNYLF